MLNTIRSCIKHQYKRSMSSFKEVRIPIPYGHIAAKDWNSSGGSPVLALHGWQDNAGTFDTLIPLLPATWRILAVDFPGHGFSSHKPLGANYHFMEFLVDIKRLADYFGWKTFSLMGHSMSSGLSLLFAAMYPEMVERVIGLDLNRPYPSPAENIPDISRAGVDTALDLEQKYQSDPPVYTEAAALDKLMKAVRFELQESSAKILLKRGSKPALSGDGVIFTRDIRLRVPSLMANTVEFHKEFLSRIQCELLLISGTRGIKFGTAIENEEHFAMYRKNCKKFKHVEIDGDHHLHLSSPEQVAAIINEFISK